MKDLQVDRDRYKNLYTSEYELRTSFETKGESNDKLLYDAQKELAERRTRMHFTEDIITGK
jgi:hypothetical protein